MAKAKTFLHVMRWQRMSAQKVPYLLCNVQFSLLVLPLLRIIFSGSVFQNIRWACFVGIHASAFKALGPDSAAFEGEGCGEVFLEEKALLQFADGQDSHEVGASECCESAPANAANISWLRCGYGDTPLMVTVTLHLIML